jgi:hypothetical protein
MIHTTLDRPTEPTPFADHRRQWRLASGNPPAQEATCREPWRHRFNPVTIGFWLGGLALGTGGCVLGACMPYRHAVAVTISVLWWGIYFGCFGASIGALAGLWTKRSRAVPSSGPEDAGILPSVGAQPTSHHWPVGPGPDA